MDIGKQRIVKTIGMVRFRANAEERVQKIEIIINQIMKTNFAIYQLRIP